MIKGPNCSRVFFIFYLVVNIKISRCKITNETIIHQILNEADLRKFCSNFKFAVSILFPAPEHIQIL